jgi:hypothetical protein
MTRNQQRLGDLVADTVVIREFRHGTPYTWFAPQTDGASGQSAPIPPTLSYVIGSYLSRAALLPVEERLALTERIIGKLGYSARMMSLRERDAYLASLLHWQAGVRQ